MDLCVRQCEPDELDFVIDRLDHEFIFGRQRCLSLRNRFVDTLSIENIEQIRVGVLDGSICGAHAIRIFDWIAEQHRWRGAMIGMVWVDPQHRGEGIGTQLMISAAAFLREREVDFGVLWTRARAFYECAGWFLSDHGLFGEAVNHPISHGADIVLCRPLQSMDVTWLDHLRSRSQICRVVRQPSGYRNIPIPAVHVLCFSATGSDGSEGFALVGEQGHTGYLYEIVAPSILWEPIWITVAGRFERLFVNGRFGDAFTRWLSDRGYVSWQMQNKAMWLPISNRVADTFLNNWYIPYFDWI